MFWLFLLAAVALVFLAVTNRIESIDGWLSRFFRKARVAYEYMREDCEDIEHEMRARAKARAGDDSAEKPQVSPAKPADADVTAPSGAR